MSTRGILGGSADAPAALQLTIRHPDRVSLLVLLVPLTYKSGALTDSAPPWSPLIEDLLMRLLGSDFVFWSALHVVRDQVHFE